MNEVTVVALVLKDVKVAQSLKVFPASLHKGSFEFGFAIMVKGSFLVGCMNSIFLACKLIDASGFDLLKPYFKSPFIGESMQES